jgi:TetR/AcrR family transcriptional regulator, lmrAB and yxaGH operons repressor
MGMKGAGTRARILDAARELTETGGYFNAGLNQVVAESGAPKGSLYFHFPGGKDQLIEEAVRQGAEELAELFAHAAEGRDAAGTVTAVIEVLAGRLEGSGWRRGCPVATVALETAAADSPLRRACSEVYGSWEAAFAARLRAEGRPDPEATATVLLALVEGALLLARTHHDRAPLDRAAAAARRLIGDPVAPGRPGGEEVRTAAP